MDFFDILTLIGGVALFLYGMETMGDSLTTLSGGKLETLLEKLTTNKYKGVLLGAGVTAIIQSSSGTTVMVVGLVNSGLMRLSQAVGVIMGANIGTTVTAWILSLTGIESSNFFVRMLKPSSFSPILAIIGVGMLLFGSKGRKASTAGIMVGFAVLMFGMETMSAAVTPLSHDPEFLRLFTIFSNPALGVLLGALLTAIIQSSSASVGILQALCLTGAVSIGTAIPIIMGQNIGTCVTALLSSVGANRNAKRAACVHLSFNIIGTVIFMSVFYVIHALSPFAFMHQSASVVDIAIIHTSFNLITTAILLPFAKQLEKLAVLIIPEAKASAEMSEEARDRQLLEERFLNQPAFAVEQSHLLLVKMARFAHESLLKSFELINDYSKEGFDEVEKLENQVDRYEDWISSYLVRISGRELADRDSKHLTIMMSCIDNFERISDHAMNIAESCKRKAKAGGVFSEDARAELEVYCRALNEIVGLAIRVFEQFDQTLATEIEPLEEAIDNINKKLGRRHIERLRAGVCTMEISLSFSNILTNFERVADHCSNIAVSVIQINDNSYDRHEYLTQIHESSPEFAQKYAEYKKRYQLPKKKHYPRSGAIADDAPDGEVSHVLRMDSPDQA